MSRRRPQTLENMPGCGRSRYKTASGRAEWLSRDPLGEEAGINLYAYVENEPIGLSDPLGLEPASSQRCQDLAKKIENVKKEIYKRTEEFRIDPRKLPGKTRQDRLKPSQSRRGHKNLIDKHKANLAALQALYKATCSDDEPPPACPVPAKEATTALGAAVVVTGTIIVADKVVGACLLLIAPPAGAAVLLTPP